MRANAPLFSATSSEHLSKLSKNHHNFTTNAQEVSALLETAQTTLSASRLSRGIQLALSFPS